MFNPVKTRDIPSLKEVEKLPGGFLLSLALIFPNFLIYPIFTLRRSYSKITQ
jgi:hypothetical protein